MGVIISFFRRLSIIFYWVNRYMLSPFGFVTGLATAMWSFFSFVNSDWFNCMSALVNYLSPLPNMISDLVSRVAASPLYSYFYQFFALDTFSECMIWAVMLLVTLAIFSVFEIFFTAIMVVVPLFILKTTRQMVSILSLGCAKP